MSKSLMLIKFKDDSIFWGTYYGTSDILSEYIISYEDLINKCDKNIFDYCERQEEMNKYRTTKPEDPDDVEDVEIFIDYGMGVVILGEASKSQMRITSSLDYLDYDYIAGNKLPHISLWVYEYHHKMGWDTDFIKSRIMVDSI